MTSLIDWLLVVADCLPDVLEVVVCEPNQYVSKCTLHFIFQLVFKLVCHTYP